MTNGIEFTPPHLLPKAHDDAEDNIPSASPELRAEIARLLSERTVGDYVIPDKLVDENKTITRETAYEMLLDRRIGDCTVPTGVHILAAGNRDASQYAVKLTGEEKERIDRIVRERAPKIVFEGGRIRTENMGSASMLPMLATLHDRNVDRHFGALARLADKRRK